MEGGWEVDIKQMRSVKLSHLYKDVYFKILQVNYSPGLKVSEIAHSPVKLPPQGYGGTPLYVLCLFLLICLIGNTGCLVGHR